MFCRRIFGLIATAFILTAPTIKAQDPPPAIVVEEEKDGLPGAPIAPSRKDIEDLILAIGRDPVSRELVDRIDGLFRPRTSCEANFERTRIVCKDPRYVTRIDSLARELIKKPADTRLVVQYAISAWYQDDATLRDAFRVDNVRERGPRKVVKGRILDGASGRPIRGAVVTSEAGVLARSDARGDYVLMPRPPIWRTAFHITVEAPGYALTRSAFDWKEIAEPELRNFQLVRALDMGGRVIEPTGEPIAGADVKIWARNEAVDHDGTMAHHLQFPGAILHARSDKDGVYVFRNMPPDDDRNDLPYQFTITHPKYQGKIYRFPQNELLGNGLLITLEPGATVHGLVVDEAGNPVAGAFLEARINVHSDIMPKTWTDARGRFRFDNLPTGKLELFVRPSGYVFTSVAARAEPGEPAELNITVADGEYFEGKVVDEDDKPAAGATVGYLMLIDQQGRARLDDNTAMIPAIMSRDDGTFRLGPVAKGRYRVRVMLDRSEGWQVRGGVDTEAGAKNLIIKVGVNQKF